MEDDIQNVESKPTPAPPPELPVEWANIQNRSNLFSSIIRFPTDVAELSKDPAETDLTIVGTSGLKITMIGNDLSTLCSPNLTSLILRSHLISKMEGLRGFKKLETLELYDNQIEYLDGLGDGHLDDNIDKYNDTDQERLLPGITIKVLDMSYNVIRDMEPVRACCNLVELYLANNKIKEIKGLKYLSKLQKIDLGANRIRIIDRNVLSGLSSLEELWLGKNKIEQIQGIEQLTKLRRLDIQSNRLVCVDNLTAQIDTLEELYLAHNGIDDTGASSKTGLGLTFTALHTLDLSRNKLESCRPFQHLQTLEELWLSGNKISTFDNVLPITTLINLEGIYLEYNPIDQDFEYRQKVKSMLPSLKQIDANMIDHSNIRPHGVGFTTKMGIIEHTTGTGLNRGVMKSGGTIPLRKKMSEIQDAVIERARAEKEGDFENL